MEQKKERRNERIQPNRPCLRWQDSDNGQKNNPESSRPRLRRSDGDDDPQDAMTTRIARPSWTAPASAVATAMTTLGTPFRNLAGCVMGGRPRLSTIPNTRSPASQTVDETTTWFKLKPGGQQLELLSRVIRRKSTKRSRKLARWVLHRYIRR